MAKGEIPIDKVESMKRKGMTREEITRSLEGENYDYQQISSALEQSELKDNIKQYPEYDTGQYGSDPLDQLQEAAPSPTAKMEPSSLIQHPKNYPITDQFDEFKSPAMSAPSRDMHEQVEVLVESIVKEKWDELVGEVGDIAIWKESVKNDISSIKQELLRVENRFENLQQSIIGKVRDYNKGIKEMGTDIHALESVLKKIITPLSTNIRELNRITAELKSRRKKK